MVGTSATHCHMANGIIILYDTIFYGKGGTPIFTTTTFRPHGASGRGPHSTLNLDFFFLLAQA